ncbi:MAG: hypothetical protein AB7G47_19670 [Mycolicibacterium sp.]|uniref:hypothetical protein n=1 Tax=Mycolicibacterium sp. TaxID=2320850 RepID=UPI003D09ED06
MAKRDHSFILSDNIFDDIVSHLESARSAIESVIDTARTEVDQRPAAWQDSERGEAVLNWIDQLQDRAEEISAFADDLPRTP